MKLATYTRAGRESFGVVVDGGVCDIPAVWPDGPRTLLATLQAGAMTMERIETLASQIKTLLPLEAIKLLAPIPAPPKVIGLAVNYVEHHNEFDRGVKLPENTKAKTTPRPFIMPATAIIGPGATIPWPPYSKDIDYEIELAIVIGAPANCVSPSEASRYIAGYTIANDISGRTVTHSQGRAKRPKDDFFDWLHGKWADGFCPTGPYLVTASEVGDPRNLELELTVNGQTRQKANTSQMIFDAYEIVSFISHIMTLTPGDIIATGTPSGVGMATGKLLKGGDVITCRIQNLGELTNTLGPAPEKFYVPCKD